MRHDSDGSEAGKRRPGQRTELFLVEDATNVAGAREE